MACLVQNTSPAPAHLPVHENLGKKRKLASPNHFKNKRVQRIHDTSTSPPWTPLYSGTRTLEEEAISYIHKFYCKDCQMDQQAADRAKAAAAAVGDEITTSSASGTTTMMVTEVKQEPGPPISPQQVTDEASLMYTLDKNKESLKRKLMMRRSLNELVDQGIYPPPKTPPAFMEQRKSLERAKIGDSLRFKIQHRPDRQQLVQQHILEDTNIDPSLHERQRLLKKSRLTDSLNDKLSHRPGVLELVQGNILQPDGKLHQLIRDGSISFDIPEDEFPDYDLEDGKSSDEALSPDQTDDSNLSDISSPPVPPAPELPTSFSKSLSFSPQINFSQESKVTLPFNSSPFTIPQQTTSSGSFTALSAGSLVSNSVVSPRSHITVSTINNSNKSRPKKPKPKPQPKSKVIKFHEYKGPPNVVKSTQPVPSSAVINVNMAPPTLSQAVNSDTPYHILLQQQQLFLQWQLEFNQKNLNVPVIVPAQKDILASAAAQTVTSGLGSIVGTSSAETAPVNVTSHTVAPTVLTVTTSGQHAQPPTQIQHIRISSPVMTHIKQEPQLGQPQPQLNPQITPMSSSKPVVKKPTVTVPSGPPKQYNSLEEMKVAELKAELKKRNLTVSGPKPQLIERLKPYADAIIRNFGDKSPSSSVTSPGSSVLSPSGSVISSRADVSPQSFSVMSPPSSMTSSHGTKTVVISPLGSAMSSNNSFTMTLPVSVVTSSSGTYSQPGSVQSTIGSLTSPGSVCSSSSSVNSPSSSVISQPGSVLSRPGSVMSPLGSVIDETLSTNAVSPLPSIQSMQSAVSVSNMAMMPDDLSNPFSPPSSPLFMENVMTPLSPDLMEIHVQSPPDLNASVNKSHSSSSLTQLNINTPIPNHNQNINLTMEQSRPPSVASVVPSEADKMDTDMDIDLELSHSFNSGVVPSISGASANQQITPPPPPLPTLTKINLPVPMKGPQSQQQQHNLQQQQILQQIQTQLSQLQQKQKQHQQQQLSQPSTSAQLSQEEMLKQQQEKIEKLQSQLEESKLQLQLQQLQHQQMQQQQQQLQQLEQQAQQLQQQQQQQAVQQQQQQQQIVQTIQHQQQQQQQQQVTTSVTSPVVSQPMVAQPQVQHTQVQAPLQAQNHAPVIQSPTSHTQTGTTPTQSAPQVISIQNPTTTPQQVIFSVPTAHNGTKGHMLGNLKQIQLPAHVYHAVQNSQGQTVIVAQSPKTTSNKNKPPSLEFIKNQALNQTLNLGGGKSLIAVSSAPSGLQQFIITTAAVPPKQTTSVPHMNGLTQPPAQKMTASLPTSPVESTQRPVARTTSNPFFIPMKEPPKYDEAVKNKQTKLSGDNSNGQQSTLKSQTMDDVLEILIRTGELPASAAQEPPPTPKTVTQSPTVPTISISQSNMVSLTEGTNTTSPGFSQTSPSMPQYNQSIVFSPPSPLTNNNSTVNKSYNEEYKDNKNFIYTPMEAGMANMNYNNPEIKQEPIKTEPKSPLAFTAATLSDNSNSNDFFDLNDVINSDLNTMDWTSETAFGDLDLTDTTNINHAMDLIPNDNSLLSIPMANSPQRSIHGSEPDLATLGFADMDTNCNMQIDVPDWLDVIMPTTGLTPVSTSAPTSFPADPILTPRTQQEVLDLFAFDESDLNTPSDLNCGSNWDKLTGTTSS